MSNKKLILGVAAGVAALAVAGVVCKRKGYFDGLADRADDLKSNLKDKFRNVKESARRKFDEVVSKGGEIADKAVERAAKTDTAAGNAAPAAS